MKHCNPPGEKDLQDSSVSVGIIGCGRFGRQLADALLTFGEIPPGNLKISTRRPELLSKLTIITLQFFSLMLFSFWSLRVRCFKQEV